MCFDVGVADMAEAGKGSDFCWAIAQDVAVDIGVMFPQAAGGTADACRSV